MRYVLDVFTTPHRQRSRRHITHLCVLDLKSALGLFSEDGEPLTDNTIFSSNHRVIDFKRRASLRIEMLKQVQMKDLDAFGTSIRCHSTEPALKCLCSGSSRTCFGILVLILSKNEEPGRAASERRTTLSRVGSMIRNGQRRTALKSKMLKHEFMTNYYAFRISKRCHTSLAFSRVSHFVIPNLFRDLGVDLIQERRTWTRSVGTKNYSF